LDKEFSGQSVQPGDTVVMVDGKNVSEDSLPAVCPSEGLSTTDKALRHAMIGSSSSETYGT